MVMRREVVAGERYGKLTVIEEVAPVRHGKQRSYIVRRVRCLCDCGGECIAPLPGLRAGSPKSCGCLIGKNKNPRHGHRTKGAPASPTYQSWHGMKQRCYNPNAFGYGSYGGRGITVCEKWMRFDGFLDDMGERPEGCSLDRIDNDGNYEPDNCRWSTPREQQRNKTDNLVVTYKGESRCIAEWAEIYGLHRDTLASRLFRSGWPVEKALTTPVLPPEKRGAGCP